MPIANIVVRDFCALWNSVLFVYTVCLLHYKICTFEINLEDILHSL